MIKSVEINYNGKDTSTKYFYLREDWSTGEERKLLPEKIDFEPGLNIVIGANGCGKSSLLNILTDYTLARGMNNQWSFWEDLTPFYPLCYGFDTNYKPQDMVKLVNDYTAPVHRMDNLGVKTKRHGGQISSFQDFGRFMTENKMSKGQALMSTLKASIMEANAKMQNYTIDSLFFDTTNVNETWKTAVEKAKEAIYQFHDDTLEKQMVFIMDEPDEGLDIDNLAALRDFLIEASKTVQVIVVLHNALLIKSLADKANVIELSEGYLKKIGDF